MFSCQWPPPQCHNMTALQFITISLSSFEKVALPCPHSIFLFLKFYNDFSLHHAPHSIFECTLWWKSVLSTPEGSCSLVPCCTTDWHLVNVSSSWDIGLVVKGYWSAWHLFLDWYHEHRDIGWAESVAPDLAVLWLVRQGFSHCNVTVRGDNMGVIGTYNKGHFWNMSWDSTIQKMASCLVLFNISLALVYVASLENRADSVSHGILSPQHLHLGSAFKLPLEYHHSFPVFDKPADMHAQPFTACLDGVIPHAVPPYHIQGMSKAS